MITYIHLSVIASVYMIKSNIFMHIVRKFSRVVVCKNKRNLPNLLTATLDNRKYLNMCDYSWPVSDVVEFIVVSGVFPVFVVHWRIIIYIKSFGQGLKWCSHLGFWRFLGFSCYFASPKRVRTNFVLLSNIKNI